MQDHELAKHFPLIQDLSVLIEYEMGSRSGRGSGLIVGRTRLHNRAMVITAAHVLPAISEEPFVLRISRTIGGVPTGRTLTRDVNPSRRDHGVYWAHGPKDDLDVGCLVLPSLADDGQLFFGEEEPLPCVPSDNGIPAPATTVAWAGFPGLLSEQFDAVPVCYFEGVVSGLVKRHGIGTRLVVDGHAMPGVSGGPVWFFNEQSQRVTVVAVVSGYFGYSEPVHFDADVDEKRVVSKSRKRVPGFCVMHPIQKAIEHAKTLGRV